jgi:phosphatidylglycerophosphate synthase
MFDEAFRKVFPNYTKPFITLLVNLRVHPISITLFGFILSLIAAWFISLGHTYLGLILWYLSRILDGLDGAVARESGTQSSFGGYLDILLDMGAYSAVIVGFAKLYPQYSMVWVFILLAYVLCITSALSFASIYETLKDKIDKDLEKGNRTFLLTTGLAEAGETTIAYTLFILFPAYIQTLGIIWLFVVLLTVVQRTVLGSRIFRDR